MPRATAGWHGSGRASRSRCCHDGFSPGLPQTACSRKKFPRPSAWGTLGHRSWQHFHRSKRVRGPDALSYRHQRQRRPCSACAPTSDQRQLSRPLTSLAWRYVGAGMAPGQVVEHLRALILSIPLERRDDRWHARLAEIPRIVASAEEKRPRIEDDTASSDIKAWPIMQSKAAHGIVGEIARLATATA